MIRAGLRIDEQARERAMYPDWDSEPGRSGRYHWGRPRSIPGWRWHGERGFPYYVHNDWEAFTTDERERDIRWKDEVLARWRIQDGGKP